MIPVRNNSLLNFPLLTFKWIMRGLPRAPTSGSSIEVLKYIEHPRSNIRTSQKFEHRTSPFFRTLTDIGVRPSELLSCSNIEHPNYSIVRTSSIRTTYLFEHQASEFCSTVWKYFLKNFFLVTTMGSNL